MPLITKIYFLLWLLYLKILFSCILNTLVFMCKDCEGKVLGDYLFWQNYQAEGILCYPATTLSFALTHFHLWVVSGMPESRTEFPSNAVLWNWWPRISKTKTTETQMQFSHLHFFFLNAFHWHVLEAGTLEGFKWYSTQGAFWLLTSNKNF